VTLARTVPAKTLVLIGLRAAGKSLIGRTLGAQTGLPFVDLDDRTLVLLERPTIADAWRALGEPAFREAESRALRAALAEPVCVLALGGGTPTAPGASDLLRAEARAGRITIVYLHAPPEVLRSRLREGDHARPSLTGAGTLTEIDAVYRARDPLYRELAAHIIDATRAPDAQIDAILRFWK